MRKTSKNIQVRGTFYHVAVEPTEGSVYADVLVDGVKVGLVQQYADKSGYRFYASLEGDARTYGTTMLREVMSNEAWKVEEDKKFADEVAFYDGPLDVTFATTACVDCGDQVLVSTPDQPIGYAKCSAATGHYTGHRVPNSVHRAWKHQQKVIAAVKAARGICSATCVSQSRRQVSICGVLGEHRTHVSLDGLVEWSDPITPEA